METYTKDGNGISTITTVVKHYDYADLLKVK